MPDYGDPLASTTVAIGQHGDVGYVKADITTSGDLVAAVTGKKIRLLALVIISAPVSTATWKLQSGASTDLTPVYEQDADTSPHIIVWPYNPKGWLETVSGEKLNVVLANSMNFKANLVYEEVTP